MYIDAFTVLLSGLLVKAVLGVLFLTLWLQRRRASWFAWWAATFFLGCVALLAFVVRETGAQPAAMGIAVAFLTAAMGCAWQGARAFEKRAPLLLGRSDAKESPWLSGPMTRASRPAEW